MNEWFKDNAVPIIITLAGIVATFTLYGSRIDALEKQGAENKAAIDGLTTQQTAIEIQLAQISTDIKYIKVSVDRFNNKF